MVSQKQIEANQRNSVVSTGPITAKGKAIVAQNATKHGILSAKVPIDEEEQKDFLIFASELHRFLMPTNALECVLVDRIISTAWRLRRIIHIETLTFIQSVRDSWGGGNYQDVFNDAKGQSMSVLSRYEKGLENSLFRALKELREIRENAGMFL